MADLWFAIVHHVLVFGLMGMLAAQTALVRTKMSPQAVARVAGIDRGYGAVAVAIVAIGVLRVFYGAKGSLFYQENPWFWAKMAAFAVTALLSIPATRQFLRWSKALRADAGFTPSEAEINSVLPWLRGQTAMIFAIAIFAAIMARYGGF